MITALPAMARNEKLLHKQIDKLRNFKASGIAEGVYHQVSIRKNFVFVKNETEVRFDIIDGGIFGMVAEPVVSAYLGEYIALRSSVFPRLEDMAEELPANLNPANSIGALDSLLARYSSEIVKNRVVEIDSVRFFFNRSFQLIRVDDMRGKNELSLFYTRRGDLDKLSVKLGNKGKLNLLVDKVSYGKFPVAKLPPPYLIQEIDDSQLLDPKDVDLLYRHGFEDL